MFKDKSLLILDGKDFKKEKARISLGENEPACTILGYQIEGTRPGSLLKFEYGGKAVKEYDQAGKLIKTINLNISTGSSSLYGAPLALNTNGNFVIGTRLGQTAAELNLEG